MILALWIAGCGCPGSLAQPAASMAFLQRPLRVDAEIGPPFDHGAGSPGRAMLHTGRVVRGKPGHHAHDFGVPMGTDVFAAAGGTVRFAGDQGPIQCDGYTAKHNIWVRIAHGIQADGDAYLTDYYHLSESVVPTGAVVKAGDLLGHSGNTGCSSAPHLHFSVLRQPGGQVGKAVSTDPYGWSGAGPDPYAARYGPSTWLWQDGQAQPLFVRNESQQTPGTGLAPLRMVGLDTLEPIRGEWVEIGVARSAPEPLRLAGTSLRNQAGDAFPLPDRTLRPGERLRIWTNRPNPPPDSVSWGLGHEAWDDSGDCAMLVDATGTVTAALGSGSPSCRSMLGARLPR